MKKSYAPSRAHLERGRAIAAEAAAKTASVTEEAAPPRGMMLATENEDLGLAPADTANAQAQDMANELQETVHVRNPVTDKVLATFTPQASGEMPELPANLRRSNPAPKTEKETAVLNTETTSASKKRPVVAKSKPAPKAKAKAAPKKASGSAKATMTAELIKLAQRPNGVTPAELNAKSDWKGAPWKWLFKNPKKTGWADRLGLKFKVEKKDGETRYFLSK